MNFGHFLRSLPAVRRGPSEERTAGRQDRGCQDRPSGSYNKRTPGTFNPRMGDREVDQQLVERAQRGDKRAFELLVTKYQRKLGRLLSRMVRDPAEVEDVTQEAFIKAYRALPTFRGDSAFYTWLYRIAINTAKNYLVALGRRAPTTTEFNHEDAENFEEAEALRDSSTPESELHGKQIAATVNRAMDALPEDLRTAITLREIEGLSYEEIANSDELPDRHRAFADLPRAGGDRRRAAPAARHRRESEMVMNEELSRLMDGDLTDARDRARSRRMPAARGADGVGLLPHHRRCAARHARRVVAGRVPRLAGARCRADGARAEAAQRAAGRVVGMGGGGHRRGDHRRRLDGGLAHANARHGGREGARGRRRSRLPSCGRSRCRRTTSSSHQEYSPATAIQGVRAVPSRGVARRAGRSGADA